MSQLFMKRPSLDALPALPALPDGMSLRECQAGDEASLAALLRTAFQDEGWTVSQVHEALLDAEDVKATYVIADGDHIVATASARLLPNAYPDSGYVHWVAASPEHAGRGLGMIVSLAALQEFVRLGCRDAVLETDDGRLPAIRTYQKLGFQPVFRDDTHANRWAEIERLLAASDPAMRASSREGVSHQ